jgi:hypothetical protein
MKLILAQYYTRRCVESSLARAGITSFCSRTSATHRGCPREYNRDEQDAELGQTHCTVQTHDGEHGFIESINRTKCALVAITQSTFIYSNRETALRFNLGETMPIFHFSSNGDITNFPRNTESNIKGQTEIALSILRTEYRQTYLQKR